MKNQSMKEAMTSAIPDNVPDPRDGLFRPAHESQPVDPAAQKGGPASISMPGVADDDEARLQEKQRKTEALRPLV